MSSTKQSRYYADPEKAKEFAAALLVKAGLDSEDARSMAECLVLADVRGVVRIPSTLFLVLSNR